MRAPSSLDAATLRLLVLLARPVVRLQDLREIQTSAAILAPQAWHRLADRALQTRTAPWVLRHLEALDLPAPPAVLQALTTLHDAMLLRTLDCDQLRARIAPLLQGPDSPALLLKGRAIEARAYPQGVPRPTVDVDILVRPGCLSRLENALQDMGLRPISAPGLHVRGWALPDARAGLDVHTFLLDPRRFPVLARHPSRLFATAAVGPSGLLELDPLDQTAHLLVHLITGLYADLRHLGDAAQWLEVVRPDPRKLAQVLREWRAERAGRAALLALHWFDPRGGAQERLRALGGPGWSERAFATLARQHLQRVGTVHPRWLAGLGLLAHLDAPGLRSLRA
jgi:hypothetical protein